MAIPPAVVQHYVFGTTRNILAGAGLCFAVENQRYLEVPLALVFPSIYAGYHLFKNRDQFTQWIKLVRK